MHLDHDREYACLNCKHLTPKHDLMECELQVICYLNAEKSRWAFNPVCIHDAENETRKWHLVNVEHRDITNYNSENNLTDHFVEKAHNAN